MIDILTIYRRRLHTTRPTTTFPPRNNLFPLFLRLLLPHPLPFHTPINLPHRSRQRCSSTSRCIESNTAARQPSMSTQTSHKVSTAHKLPPTAQPAVIPKDHLKGEKEKRKNSQHTPYTPSSPAPHTAHTSGSDTHHLFPAVRCLSAYSACSSSGWFHLRGSSLPAVHCHPRNSDPARCQSRRRSRLRLRTWWSRRSRRLGRGRCRWREVGRC